MNCLETAMRLLKQWKSQQLRELSDGFHQPGWGGVWREGVRGCWVLFCLSFPEICCCGMYVIRGATSLYDRCYIYAFFRLAKASTKCARREARYTRSAPSPFARVWRSTPAQPRLKNAKKITPVLQAKELNSEIRYRGQR